MPPAATPRAPLRAVWCAVYEDVNILPAQDVESITAALTASIHNDLTALESTVRAIHEGWPSR